MRFQKYGVWIVAMVLLCVVGWAADDATIARTTQLPGSGYVQATISTAQSTNIAQGDHIKFNTILVSAGSTISLDTATSYTNTLNVASLGRFTLSAGHAYLLNVTVPDVVAGAGLLVAVQWRNADTGTIINPSGLSHEANSPVSTNVAQTIVVPSSSTRYEAVISINTGATAIGETGTGPSSQTVQTYPSATVLQLN